jgi:hypothetical protein
MGKKADLSIAAGAIFAKPGSVLSWVKPAFKDPMCIFTHIPQPTSPFTKIRAWHTAVVELSWISSTCILSRVNKWTFSPVM